MWHVKVNANRERGISSTWYAMNQPRWFGFEEVEWSFNLCELRIFHLVKILDSVQPNDHNHKYHNMCIVGMAFIHSVGIWFCDKRFLSMISMTCGKYIGKTIWIVRVWYNTMMAFVYHIETVSRSLCYQFSIGESMSSSVPTSGSTGEQYDIPLSIQLAWVLAWGEK